MRLTTTSKGLLLGCALALVTAGCGDDKKNDDPMDSGTTDSGTDAGSDASEDDAQVIPPVHLRLAHLAFGSGVGPVHVCAFDSSDNTSILVTTEALTDGDFNNVTQAIPIPYGSITSHVELGPDVLSRLTGKEVRIYRAADANPVFATISGMSVGFCMPAGGVTPLVAAALGDGVGEINLVPGQAHTIVVHGAVGADSMLPGCATNAAANTCVKAAVLTDEVSALTGAEARVRVAVSDHRGGGTPGFCRGLASNPAGAHSPVLGTDNSGLVPLLGAAGIPQYYDVDPVAVPAGGDLNTLFLHMNGGDATAPCGFDTTNPLGTGGIFPVGVMPNAILVGQYQAQAAAGNPVATLRTALNAGERTTIFVAPFLTEFRDTTDPTMTCNPLTAAAGTCRPGGVDPTDDLAPCILGGATCAPKGVNAAASFAACAVGVGASAATCYPAGIDLDDGDAPCISGTTASCLACDPTETSCFWLGSTIPAADALPTP